jgi:hypothetical protein
LGAQEEFMLAKRWREHGDRDAAHNAYRIELAGESMRKRRMPEPSA